MDTYSHIAVSPEEVMAELHAMQETFEAEGFDDQPRKVNRQEFVSRPEFQRRVKIARERAQRNKFEQHLAFRHAQAQNPIKGRPRRRRKHGRKFRRK